MKIFTKIKTLFSKEQRDYIHTTDLFDYNYMMAGIISPDILNRYDEMLAAKEPNIKVGEKGTELYHLRWMINELKQGKIKSYQAHRWLGFIQGTLVAEGFVTVMQERDFTRPYFKPQIRPYPENISEICKEKVTNGPTPCFWPFCTCDK